MTNEYYRQFVEVQRSTSAGEDGDDDDGDLMDQDEQYRAQ